MKINDDLKMKYERNLQNTNEENSFKREII